MLGDSSCSSPVRAGSNNEFKAGQGLCQVFDPEGMH